MSRRQIYSCLMSLRKTLSSFYDYFFSPYVWQDLFPLAVFKKRGACVLIPVDVLAMGGWSVSFFFSFFPFSSRLIGNLFHSFSLLGWPFLFFGGSGRQGIGIGSLKSGDFDLSGDLQDAVFWGM